MSDERNYESAHDAPGEWPSQSRPVMRDGSPPIAPPGAPPYDSGPGDFNQGSPRGDFHRYGAKTAVPVQVVAGRARLSTSIVHSMQSEHYICLDKYHGEPLDLLYKGNKVAEAKTVLPGNSGYFSVEIDNLASKNVILYLHFAVKEKKEDALIVRCAEGEETIDGTNVQQDISQNLPEEDNEVELTAELGMAQIPLSNLLDISNNTPYIVQLDNKIKSLGPYTEPVRIKIYEKTVFLGRLISDRYLTPGFDPHKMVQITEVLI